MLQNETLDHAAHFDVLKLYMLILEKCFTVLQIDCLPSSIKK